MHAVRVLEISETTGNFSKLVSIFLGNNKLSGTLNVMVFSLPALTNIRVLGNQLTGVSQDIQNFITKMPALQFIDISGNHLSGIFFYDHAVADPDGFVSFSVFFSSSFPRFLSSNFGPSF
jgi:hypothetical protein